jgi:hypothetical protein
MRRAPLDAGTLAVLILVFMLTGRSIWDAVRSIRLDVRKYPAVQSFFVFDQVIFSRESMMVPFALGERTEELGRIVFLAVVTLKATLVGEGFLLTCTDRTCERSLVPILMPS